MPFIQIPFVATCLLLVNYALPVTLKPENTDKREFLIVTNYLVIRSFGAIGTESEKIRPNNNYHSASFGTGYIIPELPI